MVSMFLECWTCELGHRTRLLLLIITMSIYLIFGALVFAAIEQKHEKGRADNIRQIRHDFAAKISNCSSDQDLEDFISAITVATQSGVLATNNVTFYSSWSFGQAFFFAGTFVTTIGYGHTSPLSFGGKLFGVFYALIGVPLALVLFSAVASRLTIPLAKFLTFLTKKMTFIEKEVNVRLIHLSIVVAIFLGFFLFIPAAIFTVLEHKWSYLDSLYYCFISLSTIGLGDYIPGEQHDQPYRALYKIATTLYLFLGIICVMTTLSVACNIKELNFSSYFILKQDTEDEVDQETLILNNQNSTSSKYTEENSSNDGTDS